MEQAIVSSNLFNSKDMADEVEGTFKNIRYDIYAEIIELQNGDISAHFVLIVCLSSAYSKSQVSTCLISRLLVWVGGAARRWLMRRDFYIAAILSCLSSSRGAKTREITRCNRLQWISFYKLSLPDNIDPTIRCTMSMRRFDFEINWRWERVP